VSQFEAMLKMAKKQTQLAARGHRGARGKQISTGGGWRLVNPSNKQFVGSLLTIAKVGTDRIAIFRLQK
jgi:hypothetical protein